MKRALIALLFLPVSLLAADGKINISLEPLGDSPQGGVVARISYRFTIPTDAPSGVPLVLTGSTTPFSAETLRVLYPTREVYCDRYTQAASAAVTAGVLLRRDADRLVSVACSGD